MSRIAPAPAKGLFRKYVYREARKRYDRDLEPMAIMGHSKKVLLAAGGFELPLERFKRVDPKLMALAETKAALVVGCEFCIDIGSHVSAQARRQRRAAAGAAAPPRGDVLQRARAAGDRLRRGDDQDAGGGDRRAVRARCASTSTRPSWSS